MSDYIVDMHADALMWNRDLLQNNRRGHVDVPKLQHGGVKLVGMPIVTTGFPYVDLFRQFAWLRRYPKQARASCCNRAHWQIRNLGMQCAQSHDNLTVMRSRADLEALLGREGIGVVLGLEGVHAIDGELSELEGFWQRGVRFASLTHLRDNVYGGAQKLFGHDPGLSRAGIEALAEMDRLGIALDLSHASALTLREAMRRFSGAVMFSHTAASAVHPSWRNNSNDEFKEVARRGGIIGVIFATFYLGGKHLDNLVRHIRHIAEIAGIDYVGLGSDFDGFVPLPNGIRNAADLPNLASALRNKGFASQDVAKVMGENWIRFWKDFLPEK